MTAAAWRALSFGAIALLIAFAAAFFLVPDETRQRATALLQQATPSREQPAEAPKAGAAEPKPPAVADRPDGAKDRTERKPDQSPVETLPETKPETRADEGTQGDKSNSDRAASERDPSLDIVRVEPNGDSVIAGRTRPNASVELMRDNKPIARVTADPAGNFAIVPPALPTGNSEISYRSIAPDGQETRGKENVAVVIAENRSTKPLVAVSTPDKPTEVLSRPDAPPSAQSAERKPSSPGAEPFPASKPQQQMSALPAEPQRKPESAPKQQPVQIVSIDAQEGGRLDVTVAATPGATLRLYLNETMVATGRVGTDGRLAFTIGRGVRAGDYQVRVDQVEPGTGKVAVRAQVAFAFPEAAAAPVRSAQIPPQPAVPPKSEGPPAGAGTPSLQGAPAAGARPSAGTQVAERPKTEAPSRTAPADPSAAQRSAQEPARESGAATRPQTVPQTSDAAPGSAPDRRDAAPAEPIRPRQPEVAQAPPTPSTPPPAAQTPPAEEAGSASATGKAQAGTVFVAEIATAKITRGDSLWQISRRSYGSGVRYTVIFDANREQIKNPDLIYPGQIFVLPKEEGAGKRG